MKNKLNLHLRNNLMILYINTISKDKMIIGLRGKEKSFEKKIETDHNQAEKLLPAIEAFLKAKKVRLSDLKKVIVASHGGSFTSLRIGVITANALAYALKIPVEAEEKNGKNNKKFGRYSIVEPDYDREPNIGAAKSLVI